MKKLLLVLLYSCSLSAMDRDEAPPAYEAIAGQHKADAIINSVAKMQECKTAKSEILDILSSPDNYAMRNADLTNSLALFDAAMKKNNKFAFFDAADISFLGDISETRDAAVINQLQAWTTPITVEFKQSDFQDRMNNLGLKLLLMGEGIHINQKKEKTYAAITKLNVLHGWYASHLTKVRTAVAKDVFAQIVGVQRNVAIKMQSFMEQQGSNFSLINQSYPNFLSTDIQHLIEVAETNDVAAKVLALYYSAGFLTRPNAAKSAEYERKAE